jgi:type I restriction enzyme S subunit
MRPYLRAANVTWDGLDLRDVKKMNFTEDESRAYELRPGDVLVAEASGSADEVGKPALWRGEINDCCFQNTLVRVRTLGPVPEYLRYFLLAEAQSGRIGRASPGVGIHHIGAARLAAWRVPVPPLAEQRRIVEAIEEQLSRLDAAEQSLRDARSKAAALRATLHAAATNGFECVELGALVTGLRYGTSVKCSYEAAGPPVLRIPNVQGGTIDLSDIKHATDAQLDLTSFLVESGDLLFVRTNGSRDLIGRVASVDGAAGMAFASYLIRARPDPARLDSRYAVIALSTPKVRSAIESKAATTAGQYNLNLAALRSLVIPLPPMDRQRMIAQEVEHRLAAVEAVEVEVGRGLRRSAALRNSILARAFRGQLVPQDTNDEPAGVLVERIAVERAASSVKTRKRRARTPA